jgi:hypothetical protein
MLIVSAGDDAPKRLLAHAASVATGIPGLRAGLDPDAPTTSAHERSGSVADPVVEHDNSDDKDDREDHASGPDQVR